MSDTAAWLTGVILLIFAAGLLPATVLCCAAGKIPPNNFIGLRVGPIDATEGIWMESHRRAGGLSLVAGIGASGAALWSIAVFADPDLRSTLILVGFGILLVVGAITAYLTARRLARSIDVESVQF